MNEQQAIQILEKKFLNTGYTWVVSVMNGEVEFVTHDDDCKTNVYDERYREPNCNLFYMPDEEWRLVEQIEHTNLAELVWDIRHRVAQMEDYYRFMRIARNKTKEELVTCMSEVWKYLDTGEFMGREPEMGPLHNESRHAKMVTLIKMLLMSGEVLAEVEDE